VQPFDHCRVVGLDGELASNVGSENRNILTRSDFCAASIAATIGSAVSSGSTMSECDMARF